MRKHPFIFSTFLAALFLPISFIVSPSYSQSESDIGEGINRSPGEGRIYHKKVNPKTLSAFFDPALSLIKQKQVEIKVLTPSYLYISSDLRRLSTRWISAIGNSSNPVGYFIVIGVGGRFCSNYCYITLFGTKLGLVKPAPISISLAPLYESSYYLTPSEVLAKRTKEYIKASPRGRSPEVPTFVTLANGTRAVFLPWIGYVSTYSNLSWDDSGARYQIIMQNGEKEPMVKMANSIYSK